MNELLHKSTTEQIIRCAIAVHKSLGPGLLESVYQSALAIEFIEQKIAFESQVAIPAIRCLDTPR